ncbi:polysaccharide deacetylase family protein [Chloroflexota bacterium]
MSRFCYGISLYYPLFLRCFLSWKRRDILWPGEKACLTLSFDCDYEEDMKALPQLLDMLDQYGIPASFACIGRWVEEFPQLHRSLLDKGHEITNHTYSHPDNEQWDPDRRFNELSWDEKKEQIEKCHKVCRELLNYEPVGFRTPHFGRLFSEEDYRILKELNYLYSSSIGAVATSENGQPFLTSEGILEFPLSSCPNHPFNIFDSLHSTSLRIPGSAHRDSDDFLKQFKRLVDMAIATCSYINIYWDPQDIIEVKSFEQVLKYLADRRERIWVATYRQVVGMLDKVG